jgi:signal transduction histidine kinase
MFLKKISKRIIAQMSHSAKAGAITHMRYFYTRGMKYIYIWVACFYPAPGQFMFRKYFTLIFLFATVGACRAQTARIDSLRQTLYSSGNDKLSTLLALCRQGESLPSDSFRGYAQKAKQLSITNNDFANGLLADLYLGQCYLCEYKADSALQVSEAAMNRITDISGSYKVYHQLLWLKAKCLSRQRKMETFPESYKLLSSGEKYSDLSAQILASNLVGVGYSNLQSDPVNAKKWWLKAAQLIGNTTDQPDYLKVFINLSYLYYLEDKNDSAQIFLNKGFDVANETQNLLGLADCYTTQADIYSSQHKTIAAEAMLEKGLAAYKKIGSIQSVMQELGSLLDFYRYSDKKDYAKVLIYLKNAEQFLKAANNDGLFTDFYKAYADTYEKLGNYAAADSFLHKVIAVQDSVYLKEKTESLNKLQTQFETQKKENIIIEQKYELTKRNYLLYGTIALALLSIIVARIIFVQYHKKQQLKIQLIHAEEQHQLTQAIAAAKENERKRIAADLHDNIGAQLSYIRSNINFVLDAPMKMSDADEKHFLSMVNDTAKTAIIDLRETIWALNKDIVSFQEFADKLKMYLKHHLDNQQVVQLQINETITGDIQLYSSEAIHIFRIMQEAAGNSVKHAGAQYLQLSIMATANSYTLQLADNGKGFDKDATYRDHYGLENMQRRATEIGAVLHIESKAGEGTTIVLSREMSKA